MTDVPQSSDHGVWIYLEILKRDLALKAHITTEWEYRYSTDSIPIVSLCCVGALRDAREYGRLYQS